MAGALMVVLLAAANAGVFGHLWYFLDWGAGVAALVSLSGTVLWGVAATDRIVLAPGHRLLAQGVHRGLAVAGLTFLALHIWVKIANERVTPSMAFVPFTDDRRPVLVGLGTLAAYLFLVTAVSGAVRSAFATPRKARWWRAIHMSAYLAWGASMVHGLKAGRPVSGSWVTIAYFAAVIGVAVVLAHRIVVRRRLVNERP
ncbi:hypothetical protein [Streptomyces sp. NPDC127098]|uniref:hypothetical protein n=1 Tax=Streptomyces sp. NPDC127098 TaxID=3347137 RepID=UPI0036693A94